MITVFNLVNGEQIIGRAVTSEYGGIKIDNPYYILDAINEIGNIGSKLTKVCTFSSIDSIRVDRDKIVFDFPASDSLIAYYEKIVAWSEKISADDIINEAVNEMDQSEKKLEQMLSMIKPKKSQIN